MAARKKAGKRKKAAKRKKVVSNVTSITTGKPMPKHKITPEMEAAKWKPGQSGNPKGRPKQQSLETVLRQYLQQEIGKEGEAKITRFDAMVRVIFSEAVTKRNAKVLIAIMDRLYPKPIVIRGDEDNPVIVERASMKHMSTKELRQLDALETRVLEGNVDE